MASAYADVNPAAAIGAKRAPTKPVRSCAPRECRRRPVASTFPSFAPIDGMSPMTRMLERRSAGSPPRDESHGDLVP